MNRYSLIFYAGILLAISIVIGIVLTTGDPTMKYQITNWWQGILNA